MRDYEKDNDRSFEEENFDTIENDEIKKEEKPRSSAKKKITEETVKKKVRICNTKLLNVRSTPENAGNDNIVAQLKENDVVITFGKENGYYKIKHKGDSAYILSDFCEEV